jgi:riboflavin kinase/FMN adenylyltransferase
MQYIKGIENYQSENYAAVTLGKFDGLHMGHELLVEHVIDKASANNWNSVVVAFDMRPLFQKLNKEYDHLLTGEEKAKRLDGRIDYFVECPFVEEIAQMEAEEFIEKILVEKFHAKYIVLGTDFRFGHERRGNGEMLRKYSQIYGYHVEIIEKKQHEGREISSTYIKEELRKGNMELVDKLLGYSYKEHKK